MNYKLLLDETSIDIMELQEMIFNDLIKRVQKGRSRKRVCLRREPRRKKKKRISAILIDDNRTINKPSRNKVPLRFDN